MTSPHEIEPSRLTSRWLLPVVVSTAALSVAAAVLSVAAALWIMGGSGERSVGACACGSESPAAEVVSPAQPTVPSTAGDPTADTEGPPHPGHSVGTPRHGALFDGQQMPTAEGYFIRNPARAWATKNTIEHLRTAIAKVRAELPHIHRLAIGDISNETGGPLNGHLSHQSGRDVDLGLYYRDVPPGYRKRFAPANRKNLHFRATMALLEALADTAKHPTGAAWIILDYGLQRMLYNWGKNHGIDEERLDALFQYPAGPNAKKGLVRHFPGHRDHIHVRFKCPEDDENCAQPAIPPVALESL